MTFEEIKDILLTFVNKELDKNRSIIDAHKKQLEIDFIAYIDNGLTKIIELETINSLWENLKYLVISSENIKSLVEKIEKNHKDETEKILYSTSQLLGFNTSIATIIKTEKLSAMAKFYSDTVNRFYWKVTLLWESLNEN